ncbi:TraT complement resistance protein [Escherichia coli KOEGE 40 (102a)]|nr:TraT complement resistance protein [Escherichia coli KOEGE 40 (102a)]
MKRILPLILALVAGMAQADSNSDYRAGSDFAHQIKGQGSSSIQGFKPQESIPGYNANPDETKYYGGVTAGGDGGLKNDGTTEWATGETGKTITESFMNKPKDILSPDAPFIQTGRDVVSTAIKKRNLEVKTQMSETIWLEPASERTVFLQIKNTSDKDMSGLQGKIADAVKAKGYQVVTSPDKAYYWIQANVLKADKMDLRESQGWLNRGYEGAAVGAALGAGITGYNSSSAGATLGVGLAAGLVGMAADAMVEDVNYTMITDVQIAERTKATVTTDNVAALRQGTSGAKIQTSTETGNQHKYQTRVVSNANKVNLKFEEAKPVLEDQLAKSIANIL